MSLAVLVSKFLTADAKMSPCKHFFLRRNILQAPEHWHIMGTPVLLCSLLHLGRLKVNVAIMSIPKQAVTWCCTEVTLKVSSNEVTLPAEHLQCCCLA